MNAKLHSPRRLDIAITEVTMRISHFRPDYSEILQAAFGELNSSSNFSQNVHAYSIVHDFENFKNVSNQNERVNVSENVQLAEI